MNVLFDTNIFLDISLKRNPFYSDSFDALSKVGSININGFILASTFTDIYYICKKNIGHEKTIDILTTLIGTVNILGINKDTIFLALHSNFTDFEDAVQIASAELNNVNTIISRNIQDFDRSKITVKTPTDFLKKYKNN